MRAKILRGVLLTPIIFFTANAQNFFLKLDTYFLQPKSRAIVRVLEGTFQQNDGAVKLGQVSDISLYAPDFSGAAVESIAFRPDKKATVIEVQTLGPGTYLLGVATIAKSIEHKAAGFNEYLQREGMPDILAQRRKNAELGKDVRVRQTKYMRAIFQVGDKLSDHYKQRLSLPVELIPQQNPYLRRVGQTLAVLCLMDGRPISNQFVMAGWESRDGKIHTLNARTARDGIARFKLEGEGKWYVKMIQMKQVTLPNVNYESKLATLTFEVAKR